MALALEIDFLTATKSLQIARSRGRNADET
jgi:hypothetical protein